MKRRQSSRPKKPFYKKWWFWAIVVVVVIGAIPEKDEAPPDTIPASAQIEEQKTEPPEAPPESQEQTAPPNTPNQKTPTEIKAEAPDITLDTIPAYSGAPYVSVNGNVPYFESVDLTTEAFELYSDLDDLGRCGTAYANVCTDIMPTKERGEIGQVKPAGWHTVKYDSVDGKYLYNRCHLIGFQLAGENANEKNLITGTRYMNVEGMLPFENMVADYVKETGNHVLYRVTPVYDGDSLLSTGVLMEAYSVEDKGEGITFCVFCYNAQPGIAIDYATGESHEEVAEPVQEPSGGNSGNQSGDAQVPANSNTDNQQTAPVSPGTTYVLNTNTMKFHYPSCGSTKKIKDANRSEYTGSREDLINQGYSPCGNCKP